MPDPFTCLLRSYNSCNLNPTLRRGVAHRSRACADMFSFCAPSLLLGLKTVTNVHPHIPTLIPPSPTSHEPQSLQHQHAIKHDLNCNLPCTLPTASCRSRCIPLIPSCSWAQRPLLSLSLIRRSGEWGSRGPGSARHVLVKLVAVHIICVPVQARLHTVAPEHACLNLSAATTAQ